MSACPPMRDFRQIAVLASPYGKTSRSPRRFFQAKFICRKLRGHLCSRQNRMSLAITNVPLPMHSAQLTKKRHLSHFVEV
jgi:hypothetical protein